MREAFCHQVAECNRNVDVNKEAICRIVADGVKYDATQPYNTSDIFSGATGTGFFVRGVTDAEGVPLLVTAYHCVQQALSLKVTVEVLSSDFLEASLVGANPKLDIAVLRLAGITQENKSRLASLEWGDSDRCFTAQRIQAVGFALGKPWMQFTVGVISGRNQTHLQIDAAINGGNSGGPVFDDAGSVIGIVLAGIDKAQNVNYMCPGNEAQMSIRQVLSLELPAFVRSPSLNAHLTKAGSAMLKAHGVTCEGMLVSSVVPGTSLEQSGVRKGDILCSIDEYDVDVQGRIAPKGWWPDKLPVQALLERVGTRAVPIRYWSMERGMLETRTVRLDQERATFREWYPEFEPVGYSAYGGLVVQPLTLTLMKIKRFLALYVLLNRPELYANSVLVISAILPESPLDVMQNVSVGDVVLSVNGQPVSTVEQYAEACRASDAYLSVGLRSGSVVCASGEDVRAANAKIRKRLGDDVRL